MKPKKTVKKTVKKPKLSYAVILETANGFAGIKEFKSFPQATECLSFIGLEQKDSVITRIIITGSDGVRIEANFRLDASDEEVFDLKRKGQR
jgi:hypothetical protein